MVNGNGVDYSRQSDESLMTSFQKGDEKAYVDNMLGVLTKIRALIPNEIRGILPDHFGLSNKALGKLEEECKKTLEEIKRESAFA